MDHYDAYAYLAMGLSLVTAAAFLIKFKGAVALLGAFGFTLPMVTSLVMVTAVRPENFDESTMAVFQASNALAGLSVILALFLVTPARVRGGRAAYEAAPAAGATASAPGLGLPVALLVLAGALPLLQGTIQDVLLGKPPSSRGGALGFADRLDHQNQAANVAGGIHIAAAVCALLGVVLFVQALVRRRRARA